MATVRPADVLGAALKLTRKQRARVVHELLISLDGATDEEVERAWIEEAERRWAQVQGGQAKLYDAAAVLREARNVGTRLAPRGQATKPSRRR